MPRYPSRKTAKDALYDAIVAGITANPAQYPSGAGQPFALATINGQQTEDWGAWQVTTTDTEITLLNLERGWSATSAWSPPTLRATRSEQCGDGGVVIGGALVSTFR